MPCDTSIRAELFQLLPKVGHTLSLGKAALDHLLWLIARTPPADWESGARAVVFMEVKKVAEERGVTPRQINTYERDIAEAFGLVQAKSCNGRRYGQRDPETGKIVHAFGFELTGLKGALPDLRRAKAELDAMKATRAQRARQLVIERARVRRLADAVAALHYAPQSARDTAAQIAAQICERVTDRQLADVQELERLIVAAWRAASELEALLLAGKTCGSDVETSDPSEENFRHIQTKTDSLSPLTGCGSPDGTAAAGKPAVARREARPAGLPRGRHAARPEPHVADAEYTGPAYMPPEATGAYMVRPGTAVAAASERFRAYLPVVDRAVAVADVVDAARELRAELDIGARAWREACEVVGAYPAALCLLIVDRAVIERGIASPGGYFRSMIRRAPVGKLRVDRSIYGLLRAQVPEELAADRGDFSYVA
jgi:replication initiation protein RepC